MEIIENLIKYTNTGILLKAYKSQKRFLHWVGVDSDLCSSDCCYYKKIKFSNSISKNKYFLDISTSEAREYIKNILEERAKQIANIYTKLCYYYSDFEVFLNECYSGLSEADYREIAGGLK